MEWQSNHTQTSRNILISNLGDHKLYRCRHLLGTRLYRFHSGFTQRLGLNHLHTRLNLMYPYLPLHQKFHLRIANFCNPFIWRASLVVSLCITLTFVLQLWMKYQYLWYVSNHLHTSLHSILHKILINLKNKHTRISTSNIQNLKCWLDILSNDILESTISLVPIKGFLISI